MVVPALAATKALGEAQKLASIPVIGKKVTTTTTKGKAVTVTETSVQLRAWEIALGGGVVVGGGVLAMWLAPELFEDITGIKVEKKAGFFDVLAKVVIPFF